MDCDREFVDAGRELKPQAALSTKRGLDNTYFGQYL
jgi:hypothetical protein